MTTTNTMLMLWNSHTLDYADGYPYCIFCATAGTDLGKVACAVVR